MGDRTGDDIEPMEFEVVRGGFPRLLWWTAWCLDCGVSKRRFGAPEAERALLQHAEEVHGGLVVIDGKVGRIGTSRRRTRSRRRRG